MQQIARQIYQEMRPSQAHSFAEVPESKWWLLLLLRMGMDLHLAAERDSNRLVAQELKGWASEIPGGSNVIEDLESLEKASHRRQLSKDDLPSLLEKQGVLIATALVELALKDARMDPDELRYLNCIFGQLSPFEPSFHQNWLMGSMPEENYILDLFLEEQSSTDPIARRIASHLLQKSKSHRRKSEDAHMLHRKMQTVRRALDALRDDALALGQAYAVIIDGAAREITHLDHLRIAVLGEFKRGKSTIINAILRRPGFMPTDELPCTSAITEIRAGTKEKYIELDPLSQTQTERTRETFLRNTGDADERGRRHAKGEAKESAPEKVSRWQVSLDSPFFEKSGQITLIDTPGLNEDPIRDRLAKQEANTSHAAVLILSAQQLLSSHEQELVDEMGANKIRGLVVVINRADGVSEQRWNDLKQRVMDLLGPKGLQEKQIVFCNAWGAEEAIQKKRTNDKWLDLFKQVEGQIQHILIENATPIRTTMLEEILAHTRKELQEAIKKQESLFTEEAVNLKVLVADRQRDKSKCEGLIFDVQHNVKKGGSNIAAEVAREFEENWDSLLQKLDNKKASWDTSKNPLTSPKKAAEEIATHAEKDLIFLLEEWVEQAFREIIHPRFQQLLENNKKRLEEVAAYIEQAKGLSTDAIIKRLLEQSMETAYGKGINIEGGVGVMASVITAAVSLVIGYIIADVILYYMLSVISGFLNPILLAAAVVVGIIAYFTGGKAYVKSYLQGKIADKIIKKLSNDNVKSNVSSGIKTRTIEVFDKFADAFEQEASSYVAEAENQWNEMVQKAQASEEVKESFLQQAEEFKQKVQSLRIVPTEAS